MLRDNASLTRQAFLEFDLESMFEGEVLFGFRRAVADLSSIQVREQRTEIRELLAGTWSKAAQEQGDTRPGFAPAGGGRGDLRARQRLFGAPANQKLRTRPARGDAFHTGVLPPVAAAGLPADLFICGRRA